MNIREKLAAIQSELKAPKNLYNSFGKYSYRNAEGICEAFKPYGKKYGLSLVLSDDVVEIGGRVYVMATATLYDTESPDSIGVSAYAREAETKKGMDDSQVTGATSSYARKYALNGLFLLDDTKDPDTDEYRQQEEKEKAEGKSAGYPSDEAMRKDCEGYYKGENLKNMLAYFGADSIANLSKAALMKAWEQMQKGRKK